jgi:hypothetical protein
VVVHGGFWRPQYDLAHVGHLCADLTARGVATWNLEYRRLGQAFGGWPARSTTSRSARMPCATLPRPTTST